MTPTRGTQPSRPASLEQFVEIETPEQVVFSYTVAGIGSRAAAAILDYLAIGAILGLFWLLFFLMRVFIPGGETTSLVKVAGSWTLALLIILSFGVSWGYFVLFEALADGQTPGKKRLGLRVVQDGGYSVSFAASAIRNLARAIDMQPAFIYGVGILSAAVSRSGKRLGDMIAGTFVVREQLLQIAAAEAGPAAPVPRPVALTASLTDEEYTLLERFMARRMALDHGRRALIAHQLVRRFRERAGAEKLPDAVLLTELFERERSARARGVASRGDRGAARARHAIVALNVSRWSAFAGRLAEAQRNGLGSMGERGVREFVAEYRDLSADLARLTTAERGREADAVFYLSRLVAGGHNLLYRRKQMALPAAWRYLAVTVPRELRRSWRPIMLAALLFFGPGAIAYVAVVRDPETAAEFIPAAMIDRAEEGVVRKNAGGEGYVDDPEIFRPVWASAIIANNVQIAFFAFAAGVTAGIGTLLVLVFNGIYLGGFAGLYAAKGIGDLLLGFVAPHGVLELSAITIAGGAGLLIASAILLPGPLTRQEALVRKGRRAIHLVVAATMMLLVAGVIEGLISPIEWWPLEWKMAVAVTTGLLFVFYVTRGRAPATDPPSGTPLTETREL